MYTLQVVVLCLIHCLLVDYSLSEDLDYKITVPETACSDKADKEIKVTGNDMSKVKYVWSLYFKEGGKDCDNVQRCNLMIWKNVRNLENAINNAFLKDKAAQESGVIKVPYASLMPGVTYELNVTITNNGSEVGKNHFTLRCDGSKESKLKLNDKMQSCSVSLKGTNVTYVDMTYFVLAEVAFCGATNYTLTWELFDSSQKLLRADSKMGSVFKVAPRTFRAEDNYVVKCAVVFQNGTVVSRAVQTINVLKRNLQVKLAILRLVIGVKRPFKIYSFIMDPDFLPEQVQLQWSCTNEKMISCDNFESPNNTELEVSKGFEIPGTYQIMLSAAKGASKSISQNATIIVIKNPVNAIEIEPSDYKYSITDNVEIRATANDLIYGCTLQWISVTNETGFEPLDIKTVPGNVDHIVKVQTKEDTMLDELVEHDNDTVDKEIDLIIPPAQGAWPGLKGDSNYLFRLLVKCPQILVEDDAASKKEPVVENPDSPLVFYADVPISTKSPPSLKSFNVSPITGNAFETEFHYTTSGVEDENIPILYKYGYLVNNNPILLFSGYDLIEANLILPYSKNPVTSLVELCDSSNACLKKVGPQLTISLPSNISLDNVSNIIEEFGLHFTQRNFYKAFIGSASLLQYLRDIDREDLFNISRIRIENMTNAEILNLLKSDDMDLNWYMEANDFVKYIKILAMEMNLSEHTLQNLVFLRNKISGTEMIASNDTSKLPINKGGPTKLSMAPIQRNKETTIKDVEDTIDFSELIISNSTDISQIDKEKNQLVNTLRTNMARLCTALYSKSQIMNIGSKTVQLSVQRLRKSHFNNYMVIPYENSNKTSAEIKLGKNLNEKLQIEKNLCLAKIIFYGYFNIRDESFGTEIFSANSLESINVGNKKQYYINIILPAPNLVNNAQCGFLENGNWNLNYCVTENVKDKKLYCQCNALGYYSVIYTNETLNYTITTNPKTTEVSAAGATTSVRTTTELSTTVTLVKAIATTYSATTIISTKYFTSTTRRIDKSISPTRQQSRNVTVTNAEEIPKRVPTTQSIINNKTELTNTSDIKNNIIPGDMDLHESNSTLPNKTNAEIEESSTTSYVLIGISLVGIAVLTVATKKMLLNNETQRLTPIARPNTISSLEFDPVGWPRYARLHAEENLQDPLEEEN